METVRWFYLIRGLQLFVLHVSQHVVSSMQRPHLWVAGADIRGQADEPQAVTIPEQTLGPHLWDGGVRLSHPLGWFDLLEREDQREDGALERRGRDLTSGIMGCDLDETTVWNFNLLGTPENGSWADGTDVSHGWCCFGDSGTILKLTELGVQYRKPTVAARHQECTLSLYLIVIVKSRQSLFIKSTMLQHAALTAANRCSFCSFREDYYKDRIAEFKSLK